MAGRARTKGVYAPLAANYYQDDAILEAGPEAELLWVRILSFLASVPTDGYITDRQLRVVGVGLRGVPKRVVSLQEVGLLSAEPGGFSARSWLKWNKSAQEYNKELARDRERKARDSADVEADSDRIPAAPSPDSRPQYRAVQSSTEQKKNISSEVAIATARPEVIHLLDLLDSEIVANGGKPPTRSKKNIDAARLLLDRDGLSVAQVEAAIRWCQADEFWRSNILSMSKLRDKYEQLRLAAQRQRPSGRQSTPDFLSRLEAISGPR